MNSSINTNKRAPATEALEMFLAGPRTKRARTSSESDAEPKIESSLFDTSDLFNSIQSDEVVEEFPSIGWCFEDNGDDQSDAGSAGSANDLLKGNKHNGSNSNVSSLCKFQDSPRGSLVRSKPVMQIFLC